MKTTSFVGILLTMSDEKYCISFDNVKEAAARIQGVAHRTPVLTSRSLIPTTDKSYFFKVEALQKTGSFKFRGALNAVKSELEAFDGSSMPVVTHSSGNHAQALALAAKLASNEKTTVSATIVMPKGAPQVKKAAVADFGAEIVMVENTNEARKEKADMIVQSTGAVFIHPSEDPRVIAGQGTTCLEFIEQVRELGKELDAVIIPVGGGGLASGNTIALRGLLGDKVKVRLEAQGLLVYNPTKLNFDHFLLDHTSRTFRVG